MNQNTYDMKSSEDNTNQSPYLNTNINNLKYYGTKPGKENQNSLTYKLREIKQNQNKIKITNDNYIYNQSLNNTNEIEIDKNNQISNQSRYSKYKNIPISNNYMNNNTNLNNSRKNSSRQKQSTSTAQIDEQYEMQKLLELENKNYENKFKDIVYKKIKEKDKDKNNYLNSSNNSISVKNSIPVNNNSYNNNINKSEYKKNVDINNGKNNDIDKNVKNYIDEQAEKIKEFVHEEINNLHVDLIRQFEIQNSQNLKMLQEFALINKQLYQEIERLKNENRILKNNND